MADQPTEPLTENRRVVLTLRSAIAIVITLVGSTLSGTAYLSGKMTAFEQGLNSTRERVAALETTRPLLLRVSDAAEAALRMAIENPGMRVPDPRNPNNIIVVQKGDIAPVFGAARSQPNGGEP